MTRRDELLEMAPYGRQTRALLQCGVAAGPLYVLTGLAQVLTRPGFDARRHALSLLSNGEFGWVQIGNFLVSGALVIAGAVGARRALTSGPGARSGPFLLGLYGLGLIGAGCFIADPGRGFPPGTPDASAAMSRSGLLHFVFGGLGFYALIGACVVFGWRFARQARRGWAAYSLCTGAGFLVAFATIASGSTATATLLAFYAAVAWVWAWHTALMLRLSRDPR